MLTLGTGVGGGVVIDGELYHGWAELGHIVIVDDGEPCGGACTGRGHVEAVLLGKRRRPGRPARCSVRTQPHTTSSAQRHPALAQIGHHLGAAIGSLVNVFDPEIVVIGGGFGLAAGELLLGPARVTILREALAPAGATVQVALAELGTEAGMVGAALVGFEAVS